MTNTLHKTRRHTLYVPLSPDSPDVDYGIRIVSEMEKLTGLPRTPGLIMMLGKRLKQLGNMHVPLRDKQGKTTGTLNIICTQQPTLNLRPFMQVRPSLIESSLIESPLLLTYNLYTKLTAFMTCIQRLPTLLMQLFSHKRPRSEPQIPLETFKQSRLTRQEEGLDVPAETPMQLT